MGIDTRLLLRMPSELSIEDCLGEVLLGLGKLPAADQVALKETLLASTGARLADGTLVFHSNVHFAPPRAALERELTNLLGALPAVERQALPALQFTPSPELGRVLGDFRAAGGVDGAFERFRDAVTEELVLRFGTALSRMHADPRGVLAFPELVELHATSYDAAVAEVEAQGVWLPFPAA